MLTMSLPSLAIAELYLTLAHVFRRFEVEPFQTDEDTMTWEDCFTSKTHGHLRVKLREVPE